MCQTTLCFLLVIYGGLTIYVLVMKADAAYQLLAHSKKDQEDLSTAQRKVLAMVVKELTNG